MPNRTVTERGWELLQQAETAIFKEAAFPKAVALASLAEAYFNIGTDLAVNDRDDGVTVWASYSGAADSLTVTYSAETATGAVAPTDGEIAWSLGDGGVPLTGLSVTNKALASNVATLTTASAHGLQVGQKVLVAISDAVFDGVQTLTAVTATTFSFAKTNANVASTAAVGTVKRCGLTVTHTYAVGDTYAVGLTVDTAALGAVSYSRNFKVPYGL